jgi:hypothetical protein
MGSFYSSKYFRKREAFTQKGQTKISNFVKTFVVSIVGFSSTEHHGRSTSKGGLGGTS